MNEDTRLTPESVLTAFAAAWATLTGDESQRKRVAKAFEHDKSWSDFVFGPREPLPLATSQHLFPLTAHFINSNQHCELVKRLRYEDEKIDMLMVGGEPCFPDHWGYASRQLVAIEHENHTDKVDEEFYKLMFRRADVRVVAFPNWSKGYLKGRAEGGFPRDPAGEALQRLTLMAKKFRANALDGFLILIAQCDERGELPRWNFVIPRGDSVGSPASLPSGFSASTSP